MLTGLSSDPKICLVTGANRGLGLATGLGLAAQGATVLMLCRDRARGEAARDDVASRSGQSEVQLFIGDLASQASIRNVATRILESHPRVDVLVNSAAVYASKRRVTADGLELMFAVNHAGPFLLTNLLLDGLRRSDQARIVNVTAPSTVQVDFEDLQGEARFSSLNAFGATKTANLLFTFELARRLEGTTVTATAVHPGLLRSDLMRESPGLMRFVIGLFSKPAEQAAQGLVRLAVAPEFRGETGKFYRDGREIQAFDYAYDPEPGGKLWDLTARLTGLSQWDGLPQDTDRPSPRP